MAYVTHTYGAPVIQTVSRPVVGGTVVVGGNTVVPTVTSGGSNVIVVGDSYDPWGWGGSSTRVMTITTPAPVPQPTYIPVQPTYVPVAAPPMPTYAPPPQTGPTMYNGTCKYCNSVVQFTPTGPVTTVRCWKCNQTGKYSI